MRRGLAHLVLGAFISCSIATYKQPDLELLCPPDEVYASLRVTLYITGILPDAAVGSICKFYGTNDKGELVVEYRNSQGKQRKVQLDKQTIRLKLLPVRNE